MRGTVAMAGLITAWGVALTAAPVPKAGKDDGLIWLHNTKTGNLTAYTPDGKKEKELTLKDGSQFSGLISDGTKIAFAGKKGKLAAEGETDGLTLHLRDVSDKTEGTDTGLSLKPGDGFHWSPDGTQVVRVRFGEPDKAGGFTHEHVLFDLTTKKEKKIDLPVNHYMIRWAADGKTWHLHEYVRADLRNPNLPRYRMMAVPAGGGDVKPLCDGASLTAFEPADGKTFHGVGNAHKNPADDTDATYRRWFRVSDTGQATLVKTFADFHSVDLRPSPDRKRVAVLGQTGSDESSDTALLLYDADGGGEQKLVTLKKDGPNTRLLGWFPRHPADPRKKNAPVPKGLKKDNTAWGEVQGGLQAGLRMPGGTTVEPGKTTELQVVVRNVSRKAITVTYTEQVPGVFALGENKDGAVELHWFASINGVLPEPRVETLEPGAELVRWKVLVRHTPTDDTLDPAVSKIDLPAGKYQFVMKGIGGDIMSLVASGRLPDFARLGTGTLEVTLK